MERVAGDCHALDQRRGRIQPQRLVDYRAGVDQFRDIVGVGLARAQHGVDLGLDLCPGIMILRQQVQRPRQRARRRLGTCAKKSQDVVADDADRQGVAGFGIACLEQ